MSAIQINGLASAACAVPRWVPDNVLFYIAHTEYGVSIRRLARLAGCHASTILRQVRSLEARRDDPLVDAALKDLGPTQAQIASHNTDKEFATMPDTVSMPSLTEDISEFEKEACRILRRLAETGAVLAVAEGMEKAVVIRETGNGDQARTAVVSLATAQAMALRKMIECRATGRVSRYLITTKGRTELRRLMAKTENTATGFSEASTSFTGATSSAPRPRRTSISESPLLSLARRRDKDGNPFLTPELVSAGERLREDFELSQMEGKTTQNWDRFLTGPSTGSRSAQDPISGGPSAARERVAAAIQELGAGLGDVALQCCCYLEGLEKTEKRMGWSSRSGKIVLRIALQRLRVHYEKVHGPGGGLIG